MKMKSIMAIAVSLISIGFASAQVPLLNSLNESSRNYDTDEVAGMVMDANGNTYVLQNLYDYYSGSVSLSGMPGSNLTDEYSAVVVDKITPAGVISTIAYIYTTTDYSAVTGTGIAIGSNGDLYVTGHYYGDIEYLAPYPLTLTSSSPNSRDMFICRITPAGGVTARFTDGGSGEEYATCISVAGGNIFVGGYYGVSDNSGTQTTLFDVPTVFPTLSNVGYHNSFILRFDNTLTELDADGFITHATPDIKIEGIVSTSSSGVYNSYVTGSIKGGSTTPSITNTSPGDVMFTGRYAHGPNSWPWAVLEGTSFSGTASGGKAITLLSSTLYVAGAASYTGGTGPCGYWANSDGVLIKFTNVVSSSPTKTFVVPMGGGGNDAANAITVDNTHIYVSGRFNQGDYRFTSITSTAPFCISPNNTSSRVSHAFVAKYNNAGAEQWNKVGGTSSTTWPLSGKTTSTAIATNGKCNIAFGGWFKKELVWDNLYQKNGTASPDYGHLYVNQIPTQRISNNMPGSTSNGFGYPITATGATTYAWSVATSGPPISVSLSAPTGTTITVTQSGSTGGIGQYYDLTTEGTYSANNCKTSFKKRVQATLKTDWEEVTDIEDAVESLNTLNVFPNPFANQIQLDYSFAAPGEGLMQVVDLQGRVVAEKSLTNQSSSETVTTSEWAAGTYIVNLTQAGKTIFSKQIVK